MDFPSVTTGLAFFTLFVGLLGIDWILWGMSYAAASARQHKEPRPDENAFRRAA